MRLAVPTLVIATLLLGACKHRDDDANAADTMHKAADTNVTSRTVKDTTIVTHDTVVHSDTIKKIGGLTQRQRDSIREHRKP